MTKSEWTDPKLFLAIEFDPTRLHEFASRSPADFNQAIDHFAGELKATMSKFSVQPSASEAKAIHCVDRHYIKNGQQCTETTCYDETGAIISQVKSLMPNLPTALEC